MAKIPYVAPDPMLADLLIATERMAIQMTAALADQIVKNKVSQTAAEATRQHQERRFSFEQMVFEKRVF